jgi:hypothetical protein
MGRTAKAVLIVALSLPLTGCWKEQQQAMNACATSIPFSSKYPPRAHVETPVTRCMDQKDYTIAYENTYCLSVGLPRRSAYCYTPKGAFQNLGFQIEMLFQPGPKPPGTSR